MTKGAPNRGIGPHPPAYPGPPNCSDSFNIKATTLRTVRQCGPHFSSFIFLHISLVCPVLESITVVSGRQLQVTVLAFSCLTTTQCSMSSAVGGGAWLRIGGGAAATGCFFVAQPARSRQDTSQAFLMPFVSLSRARLSMAILVTAPDVDNLRRRASRTRSTLPASAASQISELTNYSNVRVFATFSQAGLLAENAINILE